MSDLPKVGDSRLPVEIYDQRDWVYHETCGSSTSYDKVVDVDIV